MKRLFNFYYYAFDKRENHYNPKMLSKYFLSLVLFGKRFDFRIMTQANTWAFRCENLYMWRIMRRNNRILKGEIPF
jgi:hypothetical protein